MKKIGLNILLVAVVFSGFAWVAENPMQEKLEQANEVVEHAQEQKSIQGSLEYFAMLRKNVKTGVVNPADYYAALASYKNMPKAKSGGLGLVWKSLGPTNIGGRTRAILIDKNNANHMFVGGVAGGLWESNDAAQTWHIHPQSDQFQNLCISCIAQAANGDIYFGTGEKLGSNKTGPSFPGFGIWKSVDDGATFTNLTATNPPLNNTSNAWSYITAVACDANNSSVLYAATQQGLYESTDGGSTFAIPTGLGNQTSWCTDVKVAADNTVMTFFAGGTDVFISTDGGATFNGSAAGSVYNATSFNNAQVAFAPSNSNIVYMATERTASGAGGTFFASSIFQSIDKGQNWTLISPFASAASFNVFNQFEYSMSIAVVPDDPYKIFVGGLDLYQWSGGQWSQVSNWFKARDDANYVHADHHTIVFNPSQPNTFFTGTDGGISICSNAKSTIPTFNERNKGLAITQLYGIGANINGAWVGGAQDNGSFVNDYTNIYPGYANVVKGGDGFEAVFSKLDTLACVASTYGSIVGADVLTRSLNGGASMALFFDAHIDVSPADGTPDEGAPFMTRMYLYENMHPVTQLDSANQSRLYFATSPALWVCNGPFKTTATWYKLASIANVLSFKSTADGNTLFVGTETGALYRIDSVNLAYPKLYTGNFYQTTTGHQIHTTQLLSTGQAVTAIAIDPNNNNNILVSLASYGSSRNILKVTNAMTSTGGGNTAQSSVQGSGLPLMPCYGVDINPANNQQAVVATELGVFSCSNVWSGSPVWNDENATFTHSPTMQVEFSLNKQGKYWLFACTHGRGVWYSNTLCDSCAEINTNKSAYNLGAKEIAFENGLQIYPNPTSSNVTLQLGNDLSDATLAVYSLSGNLVYSEQHIASGKKELEIAGWQSGTYIASVRANGKTTTKKIVKL